MGKRRFIQIDGELVEVTPDYQPTPRITNTDGVLWNDRQYQDMGDARFQSRTQHREYMQAKGLTTADDFKDTWRRAEAQRNSVRQGQGSRRADIAEAIQKLNSGYRPIKRREES